MPTHTDKHHMIDIYTTIHHIRRVYTSSGGICTGESVNGEFLREDQDRQITPSP